MIIVFEGPIAVGKSTLCKKIQERGIFLGKPVVVFFERIRPKMLSLYIKNREKYAYSFQMNALTERFIIHKEAEILSEAGYCVIIDRGIAGDMGFALTQRKDNFINDEEWETYLERVEEHKETKWKPDLIVHLTCSPQLALQRLKTRGNQDEISSYDLNYFEKLEKSHLEAFLMYKEMFGENNMIELDWSSQLNEEIFNLEKNLETYLFKNLD